jgi:hypothetical protein
MTWTSYGEGGDAEVMPWTLADAVALGPAIRVADVAACRWEDEPRAGRDGGEL